MLYNKTINSQEEMCMEQKIGFIGLGIMGLPMAARLLDAGYPLLVNDLNPAAAACLEEKGARFASPAKIGQECGLILTILPNGVVVQDVLFSRRAWPKHSSPEALW